MNSTWTEHDQRQDDATWWSGKRTWTGHMPVTRARLTAILERVVQGEARFTLAERVLVNACEFWALAMAGELHTQTELRAMGKLRFAAAVYDSIGAEGVACTLRVAHGDLSRLQTRLHRKRRLKLLEAQLRVSAEPVDALLARFAEHLGPDGTHALQRPGRIAHGMQA